jgi:hypothetical protein
MIRGVIVVDGFLVGAVGFAVDGGARVGTLVGFEGNDVGRFDGGIEFGLLVGSRDKGAMLT